MKLWLSILSMSLLAGSALAVTSASGFINYTQAGDVFTYDITLRNTGTTNVGTFWYAWIPAEDYLPIAPSSIVSPSGWTFTQTHAGGSGYGLRWVATAGNSLTSGNSMSGFIFKTTTTPAELLGNSVFYPNTPVGTSWVYENGPFSGGSQQFVVNPVPEPATALILVSGLALLKRKNKKA